MEVQSFSLKKQTFHGKNKLFGSQKYTLFCPDFYEIAEWMAGASVTLSETVGVCLMTFYIAWIHTCAIQIPKGGDKLQSLSTEKNMKILKISFLRGGYKSLLSFTLCTPMAWSFFFSWADDDKSLLLLCYRVTLARLRGPSFVFLLLSLVLRKAENEMPSSSSWTLLKIFSSSPSSYSQ